MAVASPVVTFTAASESEVRELARTLRPEDLAEVRAMYRQQDIEESLVEGARDSTSWCVRFDGHLVCVYGVQHMEHESIEGHRVGLIWMLGTAWVERYPKTFWLTSRHVLSMLVGQWDVLVNVMDARHTRAVRWARRLGFEFYPPVPIHEGGPLFHPFYVTKETLCVQ